MMEEGGDAALNASAASAPPPGRSPETFGDIPACKYCVPSAGSISHASSELDCHGAQAVCLLQDWL